MVDNGDNTYGGKYTVNPRYIHIKYTSPLGHVIIT